MLSKTKKIILETSDNHSSMLQSITKSKKTEIDSINGIIVDIGKKKDIDTSLNEILISTVKSIYKN